jgi:hypothetical protein
MLVQLSLSESCNRGDISGLILLTEHPGPRRDEADIGDNTFILPFSSGEAAAGSGVGKDGKMSMIERNTGGTEAGVNSKSPPPSSYMFVAVLLPRFLRRARLYKEAVGPKEGCHRAATPSSIFPHAHSGT